MTTKRKADDGQNEDLESGLRVLAGDENLGLRHAQDLVWQQGRVQEWADEIQARIMNHKYEIMKAAEVQAKLPDDIALFELSVTPKRVWPLDLNNYIHYFSPDDAVLRTFAGINRLGDEYLGMDDTMEKWYQTRTARVTGVMTAVATVGIGLMSTYGASLMNLAEISQHLTDLRASIGINTEKLASLSKALTELQSFGVLGEANTTRALDLSKAISEGKAILQQQQLDLGNNLMLVERTKNAYTWAERAISVIPESVHTGVYAAAQATEAVVKYTGLTGTGALVLGTTAAVGGIAYYLFKHRARSAYSKVNQDRAIRKFAEISRTIARETMEQVLRAKANITSDDFHKALEQQRSRENEHSQQMQTMWKRYMEIQEQNEQSRKQQQFMLDQMTLTSLVAGYSSWGVDPVQLFVYIGSQVKNRTIDADAAREVMTKFAHAGSLFSAPGQLMQDLEALNDDLKQRSRGAETALSADTRNQKAQALEKLKQVQTMIAIVNGLRQANWSIAAISAVDWDKWVTQFNGSGVIASLQQKFYEFRSENGHSLQPTTPRLMQPLTREQQAFLESKEYDTVFTGDAALEDHTRGTLVISYKRNAFEPDDGTDMWRERDIAWKDRPKLVPDLVGNSTMNAERAIVILQKALTQSFWLPRKDAAAMTEGDQSLFNSYQALWLYRWMGPACSRWLSPEEEKYRSPGRETLPRPPNPLDKRQRIDVAPVRQLPLSAGEQTLTFVSDLCRRRFAFLKAMLAHSLLFLFVRPNEAMELITNPGDHASQSCVYQTLERLRGLSKDHGKGFGLLILDNKWPGYVRVVGLTEGGGTVNEPINVSDLVDISVNPRDPKKWTFNHRQVLLKTVTTAFNMGLQLVSNVCWKNRNKNEYAETPQDFARMTEYLQSFPSGDDEFDVQAFRDAQYLYEQSKSAALLTYLTLKNRNCKLAIERAHLRYYRNTQGTQDLDRRLQTIGDLWREHRVMQNRDGSYSSDWDGRRIDDFRQSDPADAAFIDAATRAFIYDASQLQNLRAFTTATLDQAELWEKMFEKHGYSRCEKGPVIILNTLCVNPFALCLYEKPASTSENQKTLVHRVFGDLWFLQPLIREFAQKTKWGFSLKRFVEIQNWHRDDRRRYYLQDSLYLDKWASFLGARPQ